MTATLARKAFSVSRLAEFASQPELVKQTGHAVKDWPLVIVKELIDNGLDATEEAGTPPAIQITVDKDAIVVADNGPGFAEATVAAIVDYSTRTSSRAAYVSPTRGAQGNALQTIIPMAFVLDGQAGETIIESGGRRDTLAFTVDPLRQIPRVDHQRGPSTVKIGARITVRWPDSACSILAESRAGFLQLVETYAWLNPHLTLDCQWRIAAESELVAGAEPRGPAHIQVEATNPNWRKWRPHMPTSPHWYDPPSLARLIGAEVAHAEDNGQPCPTVREFLAQFRGLAGTAKGKAIGALIGADARSTLADCFDDQRVTALLTAMQAASKPIKPKDLGVIGREHLLRRFAALGVDPDGFDYRMMAFERGGVPWVLEVAFGYAPDLNLRMLVSGLNFSPAIGADPFRDLGAGLSLDGLLAGRYAGRSDPVAAFVHVTTPRLNFRDKGKTSVILP